jgi:aryl sulfotransferase
VSGIVWLASYPKSGNTWLRALLANYRHDGAEPVLINDLGGGPIATARSVFDEWVGVEASSLDQATVDRLRPEVYRRIATASEESSFIKVHDAWVRTDTGQPMFPSDVTSGVVYIIRNPLDVAPSVAHHYGESLTDAVERICGRSRPTGPTATPRLTEQLRRRLGSWDDHVRSWVDRSDLAIHVVRYEDLHADTAAAFEGVARFAGLDQDGPRIRKAVAFSAFTELQRQETESGFRERPPTADGAFFRRGEVGAGKRDLPDHLAQRLIEACRDTMARFGY